MGIQLAKKILVVSTWAPPMTGGPQNLYNLLSQFSADSYCILTNYRAIQKGKASGKWLAGEYFFYDHTGATGSSRASLSSGRDRSALVTAYESLIQIAGRLPHILKEMLLAVFHAIFMLLSVFMILRTGIRTVRHRNIQCIMGISDIGPAPISALLLSRFTGVPFVLYLFDIYVGNNLLPINDLIARIFEPLMFRTASLVIVTNKDTERFYRKRYGDTFRCTVIENSVFPETYEAKRTPYFPREPYSIVFTGHVYWAQERSLVNFIRAVGNFHELPVRLDLYVPVASETLRRLVANYANVRLTAAPQSEMPDVQCRATILFLPLSWHTRSPDIIATATPGKLVDYLAAGRPILIHAPPYAHVAQYAKANQFALVVDEEDPSKLQAAIKKLALDVSYSRRLIENASRALYNNHDAHISAKKLAQMLDSL